MNKSLSNEHPVTAAVIVAAGSSTRMGAPKQLILLDGIPVIGRTLIAFQQARLIDEIVLIARTEDMVPLFDIVKTYGISKLTKIVCGGNTRQQSVAKGIAAVHDETAFFAIHDGARPLISPERIDAVVSAAYRTKAAAEAVHVKDTVKVTDENGLVLRTPDRRFLWNVQTPQVFERTLYLQAVAQAAKDGLDFTDDCQLAEHIGASVQLCEGEYTNIKITTPEDVAVAESILKGRARL